MAEGRQSRGFNSDAGMTIVEIMVAAVIFFIVLTAILGLVGMTTNMGMQAKETTVMANALNSYSERIQAMDFTRLITDGSEDALSVETTTVGEFTVTITPTVRPYEVDGEAVASLKYVDIVVTISSERGGTVTQSTTITVRDRSELMSQGVSNPATDPTITWGSLMVPEGAVVWDHNWDGGELFIDVDATAKAERTVEAVSVLVASRLMKNTLIPAEEAAWLPHAETFSSDATFIWNTHQTYLDEYDQPFEWIEDGMWTLTAWVTDSENARASITRHVLIDNEPPPTPEQPTTQIMSATTTSLTWPEVYDGLLPTDHYVVQKWRIQTPAEYDPYSGVYWVRLDDLTPGLPNVDMATTPFTMYIARVGAASPRFEPDPADYTDWSPYCQWWTSRSLVTGSYVVTKPLDWSTTVSLSCTPPNFPASDVTYRWERIEVKTGKVDVLASTGPTATDTVTANRNAPAPAYRYRCVVRYLPWYMSVTSLSMTSNTVGPTGGTSETFSEGTW